MASIKNRVLKDGKSARYDVIFREPDGRQRYKTFARKADADAFADGVETDKRRGQYIDPSAGKTTFEAYATEWLELQTFELSTKEAVALRLRLHVFPILGRRPIGSLKPSTIQSWIKTMADLAPRTQQLVLTNVSTVLSAAVDDELIAKNPCRAGSVNAPRGAPKKVVPWPAAAVTAVHDALPERYRVLVTICAGLGLRQGEAFGLSPDDVDFLRGVVTVRRQVKLYSSGAQAFALPKGRKERTVPLPAFVRDELAAHLATFPARHVELPWAEPAGAHVSVPLVVSTRENTVITRGYFNSSLWKPAVRAAGLKGGREDGMHALRHWYASVLLDGGESIKAVSEYLGHADAGFTLRTYTHLMPASQDRTKHLVDLAFSATRKMPVRSTGI